MPAPLLSPEGSSLEPSGQFSVLVAGEQVTIPYRIYNQIPETGGYERLSSTAQVVVDCLFTRHHDGYERHRRVGRLLGAEHAWVVPYVVQLIGEYVIEIHETIHHELADIGTKTSRVAMYAWFVAENPEFLDLTKQRAISYWNCYYRRRYPDRVGYPAFEILETLEQLGE